MVPIILLVTVAVAQTLTMSGSEALIGFVDGSDTADLMNTDIFQLQRGTDNGNVTMITLSGCDEGCNLTFADNLHINGSLTTNLTQDILLIGVQQWKLAFYDDFQGSVNNWSQTYISSCGDSPDLFLGGYCKLSSDTVSRTFTLPTHSYINIRFNLHFFDDWEGETISLYVGGTQSWTASYLACDTILTSYCTRYGINSCGGEDTDRMAFFGEWSAPHTSTTLNIEFASTLTRSSCDVSWGLDNFEIYVK